MKLMITLILIVAIFTIITTLKLWDCGVSFELSLFISLKIVKIIKNTNVELFNKYKNSNINKAFKYLLSPLKYKSYLEQIAEAVIELECTLEAISEMKSELTKAEINNLNKLIKEKGFCFEVNKQKEVVCYIQEDKPIRGNSRKIKNFGIDDTGELITTSNIFGDRILA